MSAVGAQSFFTSLNYTSVNEDWRTEAAALGLRAGSQVLCITGSGDRPLDLLAFAPARVVAIDRNPVQNHLLRLKVAAMRTLPFERYACFLGLDPATPAWRTGIWRQLAPTLAGETRAFWDSQLRILERGVLYQGRFERYARRLARLARLLRPRAIAKLFAFDDLEAQREFVRTTWDYAAWRAVFRLVLNPLVSRLLLGDPAYYAYPGVPVGRHLYQRMRRALMTGLARENFMVAMVLTGTLPPHDLPPYLTPVGYERIRARLELLEIVDADVTRFVQEERGSDCTHFSLSDVPSYLSERQFEGLLRSLVLQAAVGARLVIRQFLTRYRVPPLPPGATLVREPELEARLAAQDRSFGYEFLIGTVRRSPCS